MENLRFFFLKDFQGIRGETLIKIWRNIFERSEKYPLCILAYLKRDRDIYAPNKSIKPLAKTSRRKEKYKLWNIFKIDQSDKKKPQKGLLSDLGFSLNLALLFQLKYVARLIVNFFHGSLKMVFHLIFLFVFADL